MDPTKFVAKKSKAAAKKGVGNTQVQGWGHMLPATEGCWCRRSQQLHSCCPCFRCVCTSKLGCHQLLCQQSRNPGLHCICHAVGHPEDEWHPGERDCAGARAQLAVHVMYSQGTPGNEGSAQWAAATAAVGCTALACQGQTVHKAPRHTCCGCTLQFADSGHWLRYFPPLAVRDLKAMGCGIDWRRRQGSSQ